MGLIHTHDTPTNEMELVDKKNCLVAGDLICDTPADPDLNGVVNSMTCVYTGDKVDANGEPYRPPTLSTT